MEIVPGAQPPDDVRTNLPAAGVNGLQSLTSAMSHVATALEQLKDQLEIANQRVAEVTRSQTPEVQLGELFTRAARYTDNAMTAAEEAAGRVVAGARTEAKQFWPARAPKRRPSWPERASKRTPSDPGRKGRLLCSQHSKRWRSR